MSFKIEKASGVALLRSNGRPRTDYPFDKLKVGEMFRAPSSTRNTIYNAIKHRTKYTGELKDKKFTVRTIGKETIACIRIQ